jgi:hypothetical protein
MQRDAEGDRDEGTTMGRAILAEALLFFLPFAIFAMYLIARRKKVFDWRSWSDQALWLVIAGIAIAILALIYTGVTAERHGGAFVPTHVRDGQVVPGQFR